MLMACRSNGSVSRRVPYLAVYLMFTAVAAEAGPDSATIGPQRASTELSAPMSFDIPAQPLAAALDRFGDATGREVLYNPTLTDGRTSEPVHGILLPVRNALWRRRRKVEFSSRPFFLRRMRLMRGLNLHHFA